MGGGEPGRRVAHHREEMVVHPRLVEDHMRKLRQPLLGVRDAAASGDAPGPHRVGLPEHGLVDPVGLAHDVLAEAERLEHLHRAAGDPVGLAERERAGPALDDGGGNVGEGGELRGQGQPGRPGAHDQHIHRFGQRFGGPALGPGGGRPDARVAGGETVEMELHGVSSGL